MCHIKLSSFLNYQNHGRFCIILCIKMCLPFSYGKGFHTLAKVVLIKNVNILHCKMIHMHSLFETVNNSFFLLV